MKDNNQLLGLELELMLANREGTIVNRAQEVLSHPLKSEYLVPEFCQSVVEINGPPSDRLSELESTFKRELIGLREIVTSLELAELPLSEVGAGNAPKKIEDYLRYMLYNMVLGEEKATIERSLCGTHLHIDHQPNIVGQYNLLQSLDPVFVLMSTSSFLRGKNTMNCGRLHAFREQIFGDVPVMGHLSQYIRNMDDIERLAQQRIDYFLSALERTGYFEEAKKIFTGYKNGSSPIRFTDKTIEIRQNDPNLFSIVMAMAALYKGVNDFHIKRGLEVKASNEEMSYGVKDSEIILPSYSTLKRMEYEGIRYGLRSEEVYQYLSYIVNVAEEGLHVSERKYLQPFKQMLGSRKNMADVINAYAHHIDPSVNGSICIETAQRVNMFMNRLYVNDLVDSRHTLEIISRTTSEYTQKSKISGVLEISDFYDTGGMTLVANATLSGS